MLHHGVHECSVRLSSRVCCASNRSFHWSHSTAGVDDTCAASTPLWNIFFPLCNSRVCKWSLKVPYVGSWWQPWLYGAPLRPKMSTWGSNLTQLSPQRSPELRIRRKLFREKLIAVCLFISGRTQNRVHLSMSSLGQLRRTHPMDRLALGRHPWSWDLTLENPGPRGWHLI